ncbi:MAG: GNAT family N-acetyltransferase [Dehalococcoidia bacterium]
MASNPPALLIETPRLLLRSMVERDIDHLLRTFGDPKVMAAFESEPFDRPQMEQWVRRNLEHQDRYGYGLFTLVLKANGLVIGDCGLEHTGVSSAMESELGYDLCSDYWGQGLATEAATAVREFAFDMQDIPRLIAFIRRGNEASRRVAEKVGMHLEAELERYGRPYWRYAISRR